MSGKTSAFHMKPVLPNAKTVAGAFAARELIFAWDFVLQGDSVSLHASVSQEGFS